MKILKNYSHIRRINEHIALLKWRNSNYILSLDTFEMLYELPQTYNIIYSQDNRIVLTLPNADGNIENYPKVLIYDANTGKILHELIVGTGTFEKLGKSPYLISFQGIIGNIIFGMTNFVGEENRYVFGYDLSMSKLIFAKNTGCLRDLLAVCDDKHIYYRINAGIVCLNPDNGDIIWTKEMPSMFSGISIKNGQLALEKAFFCADGSLNEGYYILKDNSWSLVLKAGYDERAYLSTDSEKGSFYLINNGVLYFPTNQKKPIELYDSSSGVKKFSVNLPTWGSNTNASFSIFGDSLFVNVDGKGIYEIDLIQGSYLYYDFKLNSPEKNEWIDARIAAGSDYVCASAFNGKLMILNRKNKEIKPLTESIISTGKMAIRGNFLYIVRDNHPIKILLANGQASPIDECVIDSDGRIVFDSGDVIDLNGIKHIRLFKKNEVSSRSKYCKDDYYIDIDDAVINMRNNTQMQNLNSGSSKTHLSDDNALYDWDGDLLIKYEPCPSFSITKIGVINGKMRFKIQMAREDGISKPLSGKIYFKQVPENDLIKLDENSVEFGPLLSGEERYFEYEIPDGTLVGTKFAFIVESNGLLDVRESNVDEQPRYLNAYEGVPVSLTTQKSIVTILLEF